MEIRETYAAWKDRILEAHPDCSILTQYRDGAVRHAQVRVDGHMVEEPWNADGNHATPDEDA